MNKIKQGFYIVHEANRNVIYHVFEEGRGGNIYVKAELDYNKKKSASLNEMANLLEYAHRLTEVAELQGRELPAFFKDDMQRFEFDEREKASKLRLIVAIKALTEIVCADKPLTSNYQHPEMEHWAEEYECAMMYLDKIGVPRCDDSGAVYSIVGRIGKVKK